MRVDALCDVAAGMAEDAAFCCLVRAGIIKQCSHGMSAVVRRVSVSTDEMHDRPPDCAVPPIVVRPPRIIANECITWAFHAGLDERRNTAMYGDDADAGGGFAPCDADTVLTQMDVSFL